MSGPAFWTETHISSLPGPPLPQGATPITPCRPVSGYLCEEGMYLSARPPFIISLLLNLSLSKDFVSAIEGCVIHSQMHRPPGYILMSFDKCIQIKL